MTMGMAGWRPRTLGAIVVELNLKPIVGHRATDQGRAIHGRGFMFVDAEGRVIAHPDLLTWVSLCGDVSSLAQVQGGPPRHLRQGRFRIARDHERSRRFAVGLRRAFAGPGWLGICGVADRESGPKKLSPAIFPGELPTDDAGDRRRL